MNRIYLPATSAEQWAQLLAEPKKQWVSGYSARTLAFSWQEANDFPSEVREALAGTFASPELLIGLPEHKVALPGGRRASQNDIWVLARSGASLISIAVEGKVREPFGPTLDEWQSESSPGKTERLEYLLGLLELQHCPGTIRYQLLHRAASAIIEARRFNATHAVMLVHSFSQTKEWFSDFDAFAALFGITAEEGKVLSAGQRSGAMLHLSWVCGNPAYLKR